THGTAGLTGAGANTGALDDRFDDDDEPSARSGPRPLPKKKEFTSVIAVAKPGKPAPEFSDGESKRTTMVRTPGDMLPPLVPAPSGPIAEPPPRSRIPSGEHTWVRDGGPRVDARAATGPASLPRDFEETAAPLLPPPLPSPPQNGAAPQLAVRPDSTDSVKKERRPPRL